MYKNIKTITDLKELMDTEAERWGRTDEESASVNGKGIMHQWAMVQKKNDYPGHIVAVIANDEKIERPDGSFGTQFVMQGLWFDKDGVQVERPAEKLAKLAAEQANG